MSRVTIAKIEAGFRRVTDYEVLALAIALKVSPDFLFDKEAYDSMSRKQRG